MSRHWLHPLLLFALLAAALAPASVAATPRSAPPAPTADAMATSVIAENVEFLGHLGGETRAIAVADAAGTYAYIGEGPRLTIVDVSDPTHPTAVGKSAPFPNIVLDVAVSGDAACVVTGRGSYEGGQWVFTGSVRVLDVSTPTNPVQVAVYDPPAPPLSVAMSGTVAYVAAGEAGLLVLDLSDPAHPVEIAAHPGYAAEAVVERNYAYVTPSLKILDVSDPAHPVEIGALPDLAGWVISIDGDGDIAYVGEYISSAGSPEEWWLHVYDVTDPAHPRELVRYSAGQFAEIAVSGNLALLSSHGRTEVLDVSRPADPTPIARISIGGDGVVAGTDVAYIADGGLSVLDLSTPSSPHEVGSYTVAGFAGGISLGGTIAYVGGSYPVGVQAIDVSDPVRPDLVGAIDVASSAVNVDLAVAGNTAYIATSGYDKDSPEGIEIVDISDPAHLIRVGDHRVTEHTLGVTERDGVVYLAGQHSSDQNKAMLWLLDVSNPAAPAEIGSWVSTLPGAFMWRGTVVLNGETAYVGSDRLYILDVSDPTSPTAIGVYEQYVRDMALQGHYVYLIDSSHLWVLDVGDPTHPTVVSARETQGEPTGLVVSENTAYVTTGGHDCGVGVVRTCSGSLQLFNISNPAHPVEIGYYETAQRAEDVAVKGDLIYVTSGIGGLYVLRHVPSISGHVRDAGGGPIPDIVVSAGLSGGETFTTTTDAAGAYTLTGLAPGAYTLMPAMEWLTSIPPTRTVTIPPAATEQDFTMLLGPMPMTLLPDSSAQLQYRDWREVTTTLHYAEGVVTTRTVVTATPTLVAGWGDLTFTGHAFDLTADQGTGALPDFTFAAPVSVTIAYRDHDIRLVRDEAALALYRRDGTAWVDAAESCDPPGTYVRDLAANTLNVTICRTGEFALLGPTHRILFPTVTKLH